MADRECTHCSAQKVAATGIITRVGQSDETLNQPASLHCDSNRGKTLPHNWVSIKKHGGLKWFSLRRSSKQSSSSLQSSSMNSSQTAKRSYWDSQLRSQSSHYLSSLSTMASKGNGVNRKNNDKDKPEHPIDDEKSNDNNRNHNDSTESLLPPAYRDIKSRKRQQQRSGSANK